eukprot:53980-Eustigmatos_ZCMA.PRE.1
MQLGEMALRESLSRETRRPSVAELAGEERIQGLDRKLDVKLAFLVDCTASMAPQVEAVKAKIRELQRDVFLEFAKVVGKFEVAFVGYQDYPMPPQVYQPFTTDISAFESA